MLAHPSLRFRALSSSSHQPVRSPRRRLVGAAIGALFLVACSEETGSSSGTQDKQPSVIMVVIDTLRADHVTSYAYPRRTTPFFSVLDDEAVVFERCYAPSSWTQPSTVSILTGLAPCAARRSRERRGE